MKTAASKHSCSTFFQKVIWSKWTPPPKKNKQFLGKPSREISSKTHEDLPHQCPPANTALLGDQKTTTVQAGYTNLDSHDTQTQDFQPLKTVKQRRHLLGYIQTLNGVGMFTHIWHLFC